MIAVLGFLIGMAMASGCSKDEPSPDAIENLIKMKVNGREITGSYFNTEQQDLLMYFEKENMQLSIHPTTLSKGSRSVIDPGSSLKFSLNFRSTDKTYIADTSRGNGELYIEQYETNSTNVKLTDFFTGEKYNARKVTKKMSGSFGFTAIGKDLDSVFIENGSFDVTEITYIR